MNPTIEELLEPFMVGNGQTIEGSTSEIIKIIKEHVKSEVQEFASHNGLA